MQLVTYLRHAAAVIAAGIIATASNLLGLEPNEELTAALTEGISAIGMVVGLLVYAWTEKILKRFTGEP